MPGGKAKQAKPAIGPRREHAPPSLSPPTQRPPQSAFAVHTRPPISHTLGKSQVVDGRQVPPRNSQANKPSRLLHASPSFKPPSQN